MRWIRRKLRGTPVYVRLTDEGELAAGPDGRVDVVYRLLPGAKLYRASPRNLEPTGDPGDEEPVEADLVLRPGRSDSSGRATSSRGQGAMRELGPPPATEEPRPEGAGPADRYAPVGAPGLPAGGVGAGAGEGAGEREAGAAPPAAPAHAIIVYTDGACRGNPGPMGLGVVIVDGDERREISEYLGQGTNNVAELTAILRALEAIPPAARARPVLLHSDSAYSIGLLARGWKAKANVELVERLRRVAAGFPRLRLVKVKAHAGVPENERADELANEAIRANDLCG